MTTWFDFADEQLGDKLRGPKKMAERHGVADFVEWADRTKLPCPPTEDVGTILTRYEESLDAYKGPRGLSKKGKTALKMAGQLLKMGKAPAFADAFVEKTTDPEVPPEPKSEPAAPDEPTTEENEMPKQPPPEDYDDELEDDEADEEAELADDEPEEEEAPPRKRKKGPPQQRIVVQLPPQRRAPVARAEPRSAGVRGILPRTEKIRLYKRDELGKRQHIEDYSTEEIGNVPFETFIRNYVDPNFRNDTGVTEYIGYELDARTGREKMPPSVVTIESDVQEEQPDAFGQVRKAMGLITDLQQVAAPTTPPNNEMLRRAQSNAAEKGDLNSMMMLMMMERLMGGGSSQGAQGELLLKVLDRLDKMERRNAGPPMGGDFGGRNSEFGPPPGFGFPPPPMYMPPPPPMPPPQPVGYSSLEKVVELAVAQMVKPPKSISEQVQDVVALRQLTGSGDEVSQLKQQLAMLQAQVAGGGTKAASGIEDSLANFEKFTTIVKSVAPQVTGGDEGAGGFLKGLFTSEVGKVLGDVLAKAATTQAQAQQPAQPQPTQQQAAPQQSQQQPQIPPAVLEAVKVFGVAQTTEVQVQRFVDVLFAMYASGNERYRRILTPALEGLNKAEESVDALSLPRRTAMSLVMEMRPQLATPEFVDKAIAALAMRAGVEKLPDTLLRTNGKWTVDYAGNVLLLETVGAKAVEEESKAVEEVPAKPSNGSHPDAVQTSAETKPLPLTDVVDITPPMPVPSPPHIEVLEPVKA